MCICTYVLVHIVLICMCILVSIVSYLCVCSCIYNLLLYVCFVLLLYGRKNGFAEYWSLNKNQSIRNIHMKYLDLLYHDRVSGRIFTRTKPLFDKRREKRACGLFV